MPTERYARLFRGRTDCYGSWSGGCVREPLTLVEYEWHLHSDDPADWIGVYPLGRDMCTWGCIDIDGGDFPKEGALADSEYDRKDGRFHDWDKMLSLAVDLTTVLAAKDIHGHIERTSNGYHVWVFPEDDLVKARTMRRALMAACAVLSYDPKETNPKQELLEGDKVGNYVRAPYPGGAHGLPEARYFLDIDFRDPITLDEALDDARLTSTPSLEAVAGLWKPPRSTYTIDPSQGYEARAIVHSKLDAVGYTIWRDGPLPGSDRSTTLSHLAHLCREGGCTPDEAYAVIASADLRWGQKFASRADGVERMQELVERAYAT